MKFQGGIKSAIVSLFPQFLRKHYTLKSRRSIMNDMRELAAKLRKTADMLDELSGITKHNETSSTAKKIVLHVEKSKKKKKRINPWDNPQYRKKMTPLLARARKLSAKKRSK
jgi:hypothetical protein